MKETSPGRARNRSFLAPTSGGNSFLKQIMCFFSSLDLCKKVIYCNLLSMSCRGIFSPGHKVERHPGPDRHLGHLQQVGSPGGWTEEKQVFKVKVCYNRLQEHGDRHKYTKFEALKNEPYFVVFAVHQLVRSIKPEMGHEILLVKKYPKLKVTFEYSLIFDK